MRLLVRILFVLAMIGFSAQASTAQTTGHKKFPDPKKEEPKKSAPEEEEKSTAGNAPKAAEPTKWGFGINLGNMGFSNSTVQIGLDPNVAYKLDEAFAVGFMMKLFYYYAKYQTNTGDFVSYNSFDFGPTLFARWKPLMKVNEATPFMKGLFLQAEYERAYIAREKTDEFGNLILNDEGTKILSETNLEHYLYIGGGISSGYPFSTFFSLHYNLLNSVESSRVPLTYRIGFTWNY